MSEREYTFYTYLHKQADTGQVFYVGKGQRWRATEKSAKRRSQYWCRVVEKHGLKVEIVKRFEFEKDAFLHEIELIKLHLATGTRLVNHTDGGEGASGFKHSADHIAKRVAVLTGKSVSVAARAAMSKAQQNRGALSSAHKMSIAAGVVAARSRAKEIRAQPETSEPKIRISRRTGKPVRKMDMSEANRIKLSARTKGKTLSEEHKQKISASHKGKKRSPEHKMATAMSQGYFNKALADEIRRIYANGGVTIKAIAEAHGCSATTILNVIHRKRKSHQDKNVD